MMSDKDDFFREEREYESRIDRYEELQMLHAEQELSRQRARNGGYTDAELMSEIEPYDESNEVRRNDDEWDW